MNAKQLIEMLNKLTDEQKEMDIVLINEQNEDDTTNIWLDRIELSDSNSSGYEINGEIRLIGNE
jgi:hypothetical protein